MINWIVTSSLRLRTLIACLAVLLIVGGGWHLRNVPLDVAPEFSPLSLTVKTEALGLSAAEVESLITVPMEADLLNGVPWLKSIESESVTGLSSIEMFFVPGTNLLQARQMIQERLTQAHALPNVSKPPRLLQQVASASRIMNIGMTSKTVPLIDMSVQAQWNIVPRLLGVPGVSNVSIYGQRERQLQVLVDPQRLKDANLTLEQVVKTAGEAVWASPLTYLNSSTPGTGGFIDTPNQRLNIRHVSPIITDKEFARVPVVGTTTALGDVTKVIEAHQPLIGDAVFAGGSGLMLVVEKFPDVNTVAVTKGVEAVLAAMRPGLSGIEIDTSIYHPATFIERATGNLSTTMMISGALAIIAFCVLLGTWRAAVIGLVSMGCSLMAAALILQAYGVNFNMMVIAGLLLAIGVIIDDAIVDVANINRRRRDRQETLSTIGGRNPFVASMLEVRGPTIYATLILAAGLAPILFMQGLSAAFFKPMVWAYLVAVVVSFLIALIVTPAMAMMLMPPGEPASHAGSGPVRALQQAYEGLTQKVMKSPMPAGVLVAAGFVAIFLAWNMRDRGMIPEFKETDVVIEWQAEPGTSLQAMTGTTEKLIQELRKIPGVRNAAAHLGRAQLAHDVADVNTGEVWVSIDPGAPYNQTLGAIRKAAASYPGYSADVETYLSQRMRERLTGSDETVTVRLYGHDLGILKSKAEEVRALLSKVEGIKKPEIEQQAERQAIEVAVDLDRAREHGLKPGDVRRNASALISGITVGALFHDQKVVDVVVWGDPSIRGNQDDVKNLLVETDSGNLVKLHEVATVKTEPTTSIIRRQGVSRRLDVDAEVSGRPLHEVTREVARRLTDIKFPFEYHAQVLGEHVERRMALQSLYSYLIAAAVIAFLLLQAAFGSWRLAVMFVVCLPATLIGGVVMMTLFKHVTLLGALIGFVAVLGISIRNAIIMVRRCQVLEHQQGEDPDQVVARAVSERFQPVVGTAIATALVVLPFAIYGNAAGLEITHPASLVILGGLISSTLSTLFVIPAVYARFGVRAPVDHLALSSDPA